MFYLFWPLLWLFATVLCSAMPLATLTFQPRQIIQDSPTPQDISPPNILPTSPESSALRIPTRLGLPTALTTITIGSSTFTSIVPSSTTTQTITSTPPPSIIQTVTESTTVIETAVETVMQPQPSDLGPPQAVVTGAQDTSQAKTNGAMGSLCWKGGTFIHFGGTLLLGLILTINCW